MNELINKRWILFGAGTSEVLRYLVEYYRQNVEVIVDNSELKIGTSYKDIEIKSPDILNEINKENTIIIVTTYGSWNEISEQVCQLGWKEQFYIAKRDIPFFSSYPFYLYSTGYDLKNKQFVPRVLNLELSGICNCKCVYCPFHGFLNLKQGQKGLMTWDILEKVVEVVKNIGTISKLSPVGSGEILVHPQWYEMLQYYLNNVPTESVNLYTNGMLLTEENIIKISELNANSIELEVSIDGKTPEENDCYRVGSKYELIRKQLYLIDKLKTEGKLKKNFKTIITNCYIADTDDFRQDNSGIETENVKVPGYLRRDFPSYDICAKYTYAYYKPGYAQKLNQFKMEQVNWPQNYSRRCCNPFYMLAINNAGGVLRCACGSGGVEVIGNIFEDNVLEKWYSDEQLNLARKHLINNDDSKDMCEGCPRRGMGCYYVMKR